MTHDELLAVINNSSHGKGREPIHITEFRAIVRAVVELHKPINADYLSTGCKEGDANGRYPCPTIQAIEKELA